MPNTYSQIYIHAIFCVKYREAQLKKEWRNKLFSYISGIITQKGEKSLAVNGYNDHVHVFFSLSPHQLLSEFIKEIKRCSTNWIKQNKLTGSKFSWQAGFGAFSYSKSQIHDVIHYIKNQETHHQKKSFREEYIQFLEAFGVDYDEQYIFHEPK